MADYGVTDKGFVLKRLDTIMAQVHGRLTEGYGFDTRLAESSFLNVIVTTFCNQIAELWETAQDDYYSKYPSTAMGVNLDNAIQFGGIRRKPDSQSLYQLHCTGDDGTVVRKDTVVATNTKPEVRLYSAVEFKIARELCNSLKVKVAAAQNGAVYTVSINGANYSYSSTDANVANILDGLQKAIINTDYTCTIEGDVLVIQDVNTGRNNVVSLTENLTTSSVTSIANFYTEDYGKIILPDGIVSVIVNNIPGFDSVTNILDPIYGRLEETDIELRQSYISRSALRSNTMLNSIVAELLNNVAGVETASGFENDSDETDERGLPPHSIEIIVEGGNNTVIADAILRKKAGGIQTHGSVAVDVATTYGDVMTIRFNRPEYLYAWIKIVLHGSKIPSNYAFLTQKSIVADTENMLTGSSLLIQLLNEGIYDEVSGVTYVDTYVAYSTDPAYVPKSSDYKQENINATMRQKILVDGTRIEVSLHDS